MPINLKNPDDDKYDKWDDRHTVPENPSRKSGVIVALGTAFAFAAMPGAALVYNYWDNITGATHAAQPYVSHLTRMP